MVLALINVAKEKGEHDRIQAYWNAYHCLNDVIVSNGKMYGKYCKNQNLCIFAHNKGMESLQIRHICYQFVTHHFSMPYYVLIIN